MPLVNTLDLLNIFWQSQTDLTLKIYLNISFSITINTNWPIQKSMHFCNNYDYI